MKNIKLPVISASISGGITGILAYFVLFGPDSAVFKPAEMTVLAAVFSCLSAIITIMYLFAFSSVFKDNTKNEIAANISFSLIPSLSILALPIYLNFYTKLSSLAPSILGNIYIPFHGYEHINMARYFLICAAGAAWMAFLFAIAVRFLVKLYNSCEVVSPIKMKKTVFVSAFIFLVLSTSFVTFIYPPTGDEPHYLITARSISSDFDFNLQNNYTEPKEYMRYFPSELDYKNLHTVTIKDKAGYYTSHDMGLPFLILPFVAVSGRYGVQIFMNFTAALLCTVLYMLLYRLGISMKTSAVSALTASICIPLMSGSSLVLTEIPAALIFTYLVYTISDKDRRSHNLLFFGLISFLPWLHIKFAVLSAVFYIYYYFKTISNKNFNLKSELINNIPVFFSAVMYILFYYTVYGLTSPLGVKGLHENIYTAEASQQMNTFLLNPVHFITSSFAVIFDRDYGLIPYCLLYVLSVWGMIRVFFAKKSELFLPLLFALPYITVFLLWKDWTGSMTPARQLIPIVPVFVLYAAYYLDSSVLIKTKLFRFLFASSIFLSWLLSAVPSLRYAASKNKIYDFISLHAPREILWIFPSFCDNITAGMVVSALYIIIIISGYFYYTRLDKIIKQKNL